MNAFSSLRALQADSPPEHAAPRTARPLYTIFAVAGLFGVRHRTPAWLCRYFDKLIAEQGFPAPLPQLVKGRLYAGAHKNSQWMGDAVDAWLGTQAPPPLAPAINAAELAASGSRLDANAGNLRLIAGGRA